ncbi:hypothetical protein [Streptomyces sp. NPDC050988]|uniref:hypothetical protein n=1 Tax=Streptomyces sp. NPDC050988 TaxID=3365637 RepID=UPI00379BE6D6
MNTVLARGLTPAALLDFRDQARGSGTAADDHRARLVAPVTRIDLRHWYSHA